MKLYHGTTEAVARLALTEGLCPRSGTGRESHWVDHPSNPDLVYLTTAYAGYFAYAATPPEEDAAPQKWGIVEVDTDLLLNGCWGLLPDEDWMEQATRNQDLSEAFPGLGDCDEDITLRTAWFRDNLHGFQPLWRESVKGLGNCAYDGYIQPEAITRITLYDPNSCPTITMAAVDPMITTMNYQLCGPKYRAITQWFMGDAVAPQDIVGFAWNMYPEEYQTKVAQALNKTDGIELLIPGSAQKVA